MTMLRTTGIRIFSMFHYRRLLQNKCSRDPRSAFKVVGLSDIKLHSPNRVWMVCCAWDCHRTYWQTTHTHTHLKKISSHSWHSRWVNRGPVCCCHGNVQKSIDIQSATRLTKTRLAVAKVCAHTHTRKYKWRAHFWYGHENYVEWKRCGKKVLC